MGNEIVLCEQTKRNQVEEVAPTFQSLLLNSSIQFLQREIEGVDANKSTIHLSSPTSRTTHPYSALIIATGADINLSATPYAQPFYTVEDCFELCRTFAEVFLGVSRSTAMSYYSSCAGCGFARKGSKTVRCHSAGRWLSNKP